MCMWFCCLYPGDILFLLNHNTCTVLAESVSPRDIVFLLNHNTCTVLAESGSGLPGNWKVVGSNLS